MTRYELLACLLVLALIVTGCASLTPREKRIVAVTAAIVVTGAIAAHQMDHGDQRKTIQPVNCDDERCQ